MKWSESDTIMLVELYEKYECIWNICSKDYKNKKMREAAYENIVKTPNKDNFCVPELKKKIKNLRCTYNQELLKIKKSQKSGSGVDELYVPNIKWFKLMDSFMKNIKSIKTGYTQDNTESVNNQEKGNKEGLVNVTDEYTEMSTTPMTKPPVATKTTAKKRKLNHFTTAIIELRNIQNDLSKMDSTEKNDNEAFGQYVIAALNKLFSGQTILAQNEIWSVLTKYRLAAESESNSFYSTSPQSFDATNKDTSTHSSLLLVNTSNQEEINRDSIITQAWSFI